MWVERLFSLSEATTGSGGLYTRQRYYPYGLVRYTWGSLPTTYTFTGQRLDGTGLLYYGARYYDPLIGRFISADTIVPGAGNPQALNRFAYALNNPVKYTDPSGHDPLDDAWRRAFRERHGYDPTSQDEMIRLFSIAYPDEWNWNNFYNDNGSRKDWSTIRDEIFHTAPANRSWDSMPAALGNLRRWYNDGEKDRFVQDIAMLYAGLRARSQERWYYRPYYMEQGGASEQIFITAGPINKAYVESTTNQSSDEDANVHHWAWAFSVGYNLSARLAVAINKQREIAQAVNGPPDQSDIEMGNRGANMGWEFRRGSFADIPRLFRTWLGIGP